MDFIYWLAGLTAIVVWANWVWRYWYKPRMAKLELKAFLERHPNGEIFLRQEKLLKTLYGHFNAERVSQRDRKIYKKDEDAFTYGEIVFLSFILVLDKVKPQPGEVFYDLGSGSGKAVFAAALAFPFSRCCGVELLPGLHRLAQAQISKARALVQINNASPETLLAKIDHVEFVQADMLDVDFKEADVIFINATCLHQLTWAAMVEKLVKLKTGSRVIVTSKKLVHPEFVLLSEGMELMSWGMNSLRVYVKVAG
jgi:precorrin-6B methylase 2